MTNREQPCLRIEANNNEPIFEIGMVGIVDHSSVLVIENGSCVLEGNAVLGYVYSGLFCIPIEINAAFFTDNYMIHILAIYGSHCKNRAT